MFQFRLLSNHLARGFSGYLYFKRRLTHLCLHLKVIFVREAMSIGSGAENNRLEPNLVNVMHESVELGDGETFCCDEVSYWPSELQFRYYCCVTPTP